MSKRIKSRPGGERAATALRVALFVCAGLVACDRGDTADDPASANAIGSIAGSAGEADDPGVSTESPASAVEQEPTAPIIATRPDALAPTLPADADTVVLVDLAASRRFVQTGWNLSPEHDRLDTAIAEWLAGGASPAPAVDLSAADALAIAWRGDDLVATAGGPGSESTRVAGDPGDAASLVLPPLVRDRLPADALVTAWVSDVAVGPASLREGLAFLADAGVSTVAVAVRADGEVVVALEAEDPEAVSHAFGRGQVFVSQALGQLNASASPSVSPWVTYLNRTTQALFGRLTLHREDTTVELRVAAPDCGSPLRNFVAVGLVFGAAEAAAHDPRTPSVPFVSMVGSYGPCEPLVGPPPALPTHFAQFGPERRDVRATMVLFDYGAIFRAGLPTLFGLLPFAHSPQTVEEILGRSPLGMSGFDDAEARGAYVFERSEAAGSPYRRALVLPLAVAAHVPDEGGIDDMIPAAMPMIGMTWATPGFDLAERAGRPLPAIWGVAAESVTDEAVAAMIVGPAIVRTWSDPLPPADVLGRLLRWADAASVSFTADASIEVVFTGAGEPVDAESLRSGIADALFGLAGAANLNGATDPVRRAAWSSALDAALAEVSITTSPGVVRFSVTGSTAPVLGALLTWAGPALSTLVERGPIELPRPALGGGFSLP